MKQIDDTQNINDSHRIKNNYKVVNTKLHLDNFKVCNPTLRNQMVKRNKL